jgi:hypothetical protein
LNWEQIEAKNYCLRVECRDQRDGTDVQMDETGRGHRTTANLISRRFALGLENTELGIQCSFVFGLEMLDWGCADVDANPQLIMLAERATCRKCQ